MAVTTKTWGGQALPLDGSSLRTNVIFNDDCIKGMSLMPNESVDLIITDPPYRTTARGNAGNSGGMLQKDINRKGQVFQHNDVDCIKYAPEFYRILKSSGHCYVMTNHVNLIHILNVFYEKWISLYQVSYLEQGKTRLWDSIICRSLNTFYSLEKVKV